MVFAHSIGTQNDLNDTYQQHHGKSLLAANKAIWLTANL
jgi:hypothetical protein